MSTDKEKTMPNLSGPEHYREAQVELELSESEELASMPERQEMALKRAHVHAMLAVAGAIVDVSQRDNLRAWNEAMGVHRD